MAAVLGSLWACGDDDSAVGNNAVADAGTLDASARDSGRSNDAGHDAGHAVDAASDAALFDAGSDASDGTADTITRLSGPSGFVNLDEGYVVAEFYAGATIVRDSTVPECVALLRQTEATVDAGPITIGGEVVGKEGGLSEEGTFNYDADEGGYFFEGDGNGIFPVGEGYTLSVSLDGIADFPAASVGELATPINDDATFTQPVLNAERALTLPTNADFVFAWTAPEGAAGQSVTVSLSDFQDSESGAKGALYCNFPVEAGGGRISAGLLAAIREVAGGGVMTADLGGAVLLGGSEAAYLVRTRRAESTNWSSQSTEPYQISVTLE